MPHGHWAWAQRGKAVQHEGIVTSAPWACTLCRKGHCWHMTTGNAWGTDSYAACVTGSLSTDKDEPSAALGLRAGICDCGAWDGCLFCLQYCLCPRAWGFGLLGVCTEACWLARCAWLRFYAWYVAAVARFGMDNNPGTDENRFLHRVCSCAKDMMACRGSLHGKPRCTRTRVHWMVCSTWLVGQVQGAVELYHPGTSGNQRTVCCTGCCAFCVTLIYAAHFCF